MNNLRNFIVTVPFYVLCVIIMLQYVNERDALVREIVEVRQEHAETKRKFLDLFELTTSNIEHLHDTADNLNKKLNKESEKVLVLEESIDPKNARWAKIKKVRKAVQDTIRKEGYKNTPNIIGLTTYASAVVDYTEMYDVPIPLVLAMTRRESAFNPKAVSHANAKGLMQMMDATAVEVAGDLGVRHYNIFKISTNVRFGTWYISKLMDLFDGDVALAVRAYNCGPTCVSKVLANEWRDYPEETRLYVEKVMLWKTDYEWMGL